MKTIGWLIYIFFYGGLVLQFSLGKIHGKSLFLMIFKTILWWITWLTAFGWLVVSVLLFKRKYFFELAASKDQHASAVLGLNKDLTISNYIGEAIRDKKATKGMIKFDRGLSYFDKNSDNHSLDSIGH